MNKASVTHWEQLPLMLNVKAAAEFIGCGEQTIRMLCHTKEIPHFRVGRAFAIPRDKLRQWIEKISAAEIS